MQVFGFKEKMVLVALVGFTGGVTMALMVFLDNVFAGRDALLAVVSASLGAAVGGRCSLWLFGHREMAGWFLAGVGAVLATLIGSALGVEVFLCLGLLLDGGGGVTLSGLLEAAMIGVMVVFYSLSYPWIGLSWGVLMALTHVVARRLRKPAEILHGDG